MDMIITGSTGGIGHCIVKNALRSPEVSNVYCQYRDKKKFLALMGDEVLQIESEKPESFCEGDTTNILKQLYKNPSQEIVCICTAFSIIPIKSVGNYLSEEIKENISVNIIDMVLFINALVHYYHQYQSQLRIVNIDSGAAYKPLEGWGLYSASKAYVNMFLRTIQLENPGMKIVSYEPGVVDTPMQEEIRRTDKKVFGQVDIFKEYYDKGKLHSPDLIAKDIIHRFVENWDATDFTGGFGR